MGSWLQTAVREVLDIPLHRFVGLTLNDDARPEQGVSFTVGDASVNNKDVLHGGLMGGLLDVACYLAVLPTLDAEHNAVTHDSSISLVRSVARGTDVTIRGEVLRRGRTLVFCRAEATAGGKLVAFGQVTKSIVSVA